MNYYKQFDFSQYLFCDYDDKNLNKINNKNYNNDFGDKSKFRLGYCFACGKKLVPIGSNRKGGGKGFDWGSRRFHKKCL
jgi:hypothetical protein